MRESRLKRNKQKRKKKNFVVYVILVVFVLVLIGTYMVNKKAYTKSEKVSKAEEPIIKKDKNKDVVDSILISAGGDTTLGIDPKFSYDGSILETIHKNKDNYKYLMENVSDIFSKDDYTILNLETTFTNTNVKREKGHKVQYHFKGDPKFSSILKESSIEGVTIANNHIYDYGTKGFEDTVKSLEDKDIDITGEGYKITKSIKNIKVGILGYQAWGDTIDLRNKIAKDIDSFKKDNVDIIITYFHWGKEKKYTEEMYQKNLAHYTIDSGAYVVLGSHSHVIQPIENYKGKLIAYSLGNFSFGGNKNPSDKDTFIIQMKFNFSNNKYKNTEYKLIPVSISSNKNYNDYKPTPLKDKEKERVVNKIKDLSPTLKNKNITEFFVLD